jgi:hypothetical protein
MTVAAVLEPGRPNGSARPRLQLVGGLDGSPPGPEHPVTGPRPSVHTGADVADHRRARRSASVRRRRIGASVAVVGLVTLLALPVSALAGHPAAGSPGASVAPPTPGLPLEVQAGQGTYYVARPGDTLRSIAGRLDAAHATRLAARLASELGSGTIVPGEHIPVP